MDSTSVSNFCFKFVYHHPCLVTLYYSDLLWSDFNLTKLIKVQGMILNILEDTVYPCLMKHSAPLFFINIKWWNYMNQKHFTNHDQICMKNTQQSYGTFLSIRKLIKSHQIVFTQSQQHNVYFPWDTTLRKYESICLRLKHNYKHFS